MSQEIEIRLSARPDDLARLARGAFVKRFAQGRPATRQLNTIYYDTPEMALAKTGISLRVRKQGRAFIQTVKGSNSGALVSARGEWESPLPSAIPDLRFIPDPEMRERVMMLTAGAPVEAKIETDIRRTTRQLKTEAGDEVELAFDRGEIRPLLNGHGNVQVSEVELELKRGSPAALYEIARGMAEETGFTVRTESKAERGIRALEGRALTAKKSGRATLPVGATAEDAFRATLMLCLRHLAQNAPVVSEARDVEGVHQLRVGLRRLRAALSAFGEAFGTPPLADLRMRAKALADEFGETRELDVFAAELLAPVEAAAGTRAGLSTVRLELEGLRRDAWNDAVALTSSEGFTGFLLDLAACAETRAWREDALPEQLAEFARPAVELACEALTERDRKARKRARHLSRLDVGERHCLRIALKKLRYSAEFFAPLFPGKDLAQYLKRLSKVQDDFGALNDASTVDHVLTRVSEHAGADAGADLREGIAFVEGWHESRIEPIWDTARKRWKRFSASAPFWK